MDVVKTFIIKHEIIERYIDSAKYKKFIELNKNNYYNEKEYIKINFIDAITTFPNLILEIDFRNKNNEYIFYEFIVVFNSKVLNLTTNLFNSILIKKPTNITINEFINEIDKQIIFNRCNWNVYASK